PCLRVVSWSYNINIMFVFLGTQFHLSKFLSHSTDSTSINSIEEDEFSASTLIEKANRNLGQRLDEPLVMFGDIAVDTGFMNADPCTARGCKWEKSSDGNVYVPYVISNEYFSDFLIPSVIQSGLQTFASSTCVRFFLRTNQRDFVDIQYITSCFSYLGRQGNGQVVSLSKNGCVYLSVVQHELLHALGFNHKQTRSDRDSHVQILTQNIIPVSRPGLKRQAGVFTFCPMLSGSRFAFSRNKQPTIPPIPDINAVIGRATQMSPIDIMRVNRLYSCTKLGEQLD
uniref:Metalloendopeptidase n=1 Tax=Hucho hucho TaxID=62062 RepID=A0A4W5P027_9TELE